MTGDGLADLITPNPDHVAILVAEEDGGFRPRATLPAPFGPFSVVAADLNGDGSAEVLVASYAGGEVAVLVGGDTPLLHRIEIVGSPYGLATGDFDGDGRLDFALIGPPELGLSPDLLRESPHRDGRNIEFVGLDERDEAVRAEGVRHLELPGG